MLRTLARDQLGHSMMEQTRCGLRLQSGGHDVRCGLFGNTFKEEAPRTNVLPTWRTVCRAERLHSVQMSVWDRGPMHGLKKREQLGDSVIWLVEISDQRPRMGADFSGHFGFGAERLAINGDGTADCQVFERDSGRFLVGPPITQIAQSPNPRLRTPAVRSTAEGEET